MELTAPFSSTGEIGNLFVRQIKLDMHGCFHTVSVSGLPIALPKLGQRGVCTGEVFPCNFGEGLEWIYSHVLFFPGQSSLDRKLLVLTARE